VHDNINSFLHNYWNCSVSTTLVYTCTDNNLPVDEIVPRIT